MMFAKVLIIQTASIGDVILVTPVIEQIHRTFPATRIDLLIRSGFESLFNNHPFLHDLLLWDKKTSKYKHLYQLLKTIRAAKYDAVFTVQRYASSGLLTAFSGAPMRVGFDKNPFSMLFTRRIRHTIGVKNQSVHETERNLSLVEFFAGKGDPRPRLYPGQADIARMSPFKTGKYICIAPASLWFTKQFPEDRWIDLIQHIDPDIPIYLLGSKADHELCERIGKLSSHANLINFSGKLSLLESAALMRDAAMNYVNDSAPMHLCSAVNAKTTAIFCSTIPGFGFGPLSDNAFIVETDEALKCRPCGLHGHQQCPEKHFRCATEITTDKLLKSI